MGVIRIKRKLFNILSWAILGSILILVFIIDRRKMVLLFLPLIVGLLCMLAECKEKIEFNIAIYIFLSSCGVVLLIYLLK